jgi:hypothetical protein
MWPGGPLFLVKMLRFSTSWTHEFFVDLST